MLVYAKAQRGRQANEDINTFKFCQKALNIFTLQNENKIAYKEV